MGTASRKAVEIAHRPDQAKPTSSSSSVAPPELHRRPESANKEFREKELATAIIGKQGDC
jgi:hypothetical protein